MGEAFDRTGHFLGSAEGQTKSEVLEKLQRQFGDRASEIRIREQMGSEAEMPRYRCHKEVWALKIERVQLDSKEAQIEGRETDGSARLFMEPPYGPVRVDHAYMRKHNPQPGGYYVVYKDGYKSFSPAEAFEDGYTKI